METVEDRQVFTRDQLQELIRGRRIVNMPMSLSEICILVAILLKYFVCAAGTLLYRLAGRY